VRFLVETGKDGSSSGGPLVDPNTTDNSDYTALHLAAGKGHLEIVQVRRLK